MKLSIKIVVCGFLAALGLFFHQTPSVHATEHACTIVWENRELYDGDTGSLTDNQYLFSWAWHPIFTSGAFMIVRGPAEYRLTDGHMAKASLWECESETDLREMVAETIRDKAGRVTQPYAYLINGKRYKSTNDCPVPTVEDFNRLRVDWTLNAGVSALVYDPNNLEFTILDKSYRSFQVHNLKLMMVQELPCEADAILFQFIGGIRNGRFVRPETLVTMRPITSGQRVIVLPVVNAR